MVSNTDTITINAPVEKVFSFILDPNNLVEIMPSLQEVHNLQQQAGGGYNYDWTYKMAGLRQEGSTEIVNVIPNQLIEVASKGGIDSHWWWKFSGQGNSTDLSVTTEYTIPIPVLGKLAEAIIVKQNKNESMATLNNLKARMELETAPAAN